MSEWLTILTYKFTYCQEFWNFQMSIVAHIKFPEFSISEIWSRWAVYKNCHQLINSRRIDVKEVISSVRATFIAKSLPKNTLSIFIGEILAEGITKWEILRLWIPMPTTPFQAELSVKITRRVRFYGKKMVLSRKKIGYSIVASHND